MNSKNIDTEQFNPFEGYDAHMPEWAQGGFDTLSCEVCLSEVDVYFLFEHLIRHLLLLQEGKNDLRICPIEESKWLVLRWINLLCLQPGLFDPDSAKEEFDRIYTYSWQATRNSNGDSRAEINKLMDKYIVSRDKIIGLSELPF
jgi:hypothetical protein